MNVTIGILAHVDAGKTTLSESLLYNTNTIRKKGRVDNQEAFLDSHIIEKERGITIFSDQAVINYKGNYYYLLDTPGHIDFSPEMERALMVMDYAILIISAVDGVEGHTETVWELLRKYKIPTYLFINKIDLKHSSEADVIKEIKRQLSKDICFIDRKNINNFDESVIEFVADRDEQLLEKYLEDGYDEMLWDETMNRLINESKLFLCTSGSALLDDGVIDFFGIINKYLEVAHEGNGFGGQVYKVRHDKNGNRVTYMKVNCGNLKVKETLSYGDLSNNKQLNEKVNEIRIYNGAKYENVDEGVKGQLIGITGLTKTYPGQKFGRDVKKHSFQLVPTLQAKVSFREGVNINDVLKAFYYLNDEEPSLQVVYDEETKEIHIHVMGQVQLEIIERIMKDRFDLTVRLEEPTILYKETIEDTVIGCGHFEPLKHYAEVHLRIEPAKRGAGITFESECLKEELTNNYQQLVKHHIFEREHRGILIGAALTDVKITLLNGRAHNKHTHGGDFREATYRAIRQGLEQAQCALLEPYYTIEIKVSDDLIGRVMADVQKAKGTFEPPVIEGDIAFIKGKVPVSTFINYPMELMAFTGGKGRIKMIFSGYGFCHNYNEVIEASSYDKKVDRTYTSTSIFCAKGKGYEVSFQEAKAHMHCEIKE